ncbi:MAG: hypothetical protein ACPGD5_03845 [Salibacteraceae bacterium]
MEEQYFNEIRDKFCSLAAEIEKGKMMSAEAIIYQNKVFAFFSRDKKMVFKLGKSFDTKSLGIETNVFNPFKKRAPLNGWFEIDYSNKEQWLPLTERALGVLKKEVFEAEAV